MIDESKNPNTEELIRMARQHAECLRLAGVEWLPGGLPFVGSALRLTTKNPAVNAAPEPAPRLAKEPFSIPTGESAYAVSSEMARSAAPGILAMETKEERRQALAVLAETVSKCPRCPELLATRTQTVFGVGRIDPELCFIGEAPGADEDARGEPFVGAAGQLLNRIIVACGLKREEVYICNILKCRPPGNRLPLANEAAHCREYLEKQLDLVRPQYICALGACAAQNLLGTTLSIGRLRGSFHDFKGIPVMCTYHPAYLLRSPDKKADVWTDMKKLLTRMGKPIPMKSS